MRWNEGENSKAHMKVLQVIVKLDEMDSERKEDKHRVRNMSEQSYERE